MNTIFEINNNFRVMECSDLIYTLTNSEKMKSEQLKNEAMDSNNISLSDILETLTPARKQVAYAAIELYKRLKENTVNTMIIKSSSDIFSIMYPMLCDIKTEEFWILIINSSSKVLRKIRISCGGMGEVTTDIRIIMKQAIHYEATNIAIVHNHPSGNIRPSEADNLFTAQINKACEIMQIPLIDHVIISGNCEGKYYSYCDEGNIL